MRISVIVPAYNARHYLGASLPPLLELAAAGSIAEVIVIDDASPDHGAALAGALGARVLRLERRSGPGAARNAGARVAQGEVLWFVDADVVVHPGALPRIARHFQAPALTAVFGSYDDAPPEKNFFSQYKNLVHHFHHQRNAGRSTSFWAGCGAVRRQAFLDAGGFDAERYPDASIEDIELGHRLSRRGAHIELDPALLCTHLKRWSLCQVVRTDIRMRALPWSRLLLAGQAPSRELNVAPAERRAAFMAGVLALSLPLSLHPAAPPLLPVYAAAAALGCNRALVGFFRRKRGVLFSIGAFLYQQVAYLYSGSVLGWCWVERRTRRRGSC